MKRADRRAWHQGPSFNYKASPKPLVVNVAISSWAIRGLRHAAVVHQIIGQFKRKRSGGTILDFGAGSWLRYVQHLRKTMPSSELFAVEYSEAFHEEAEALRQNLEAHITLWSPTDFVKSKPKGFDLVLVVNVLNTIPEEAHRRSIFKSLAQRLNPNGWLVVYQRIWALSENPPGAIEYDDGWLVPQENYNCYTYRARTGHRWFNDRAGEAGLRAMTVPEISSSNTLLRLWEKPF